MTLLVALTQTSAVTQRSSSSPIFPRHSSLLHLSSSHHSSKHPPSSIHLPMADYFDVAAGSGVGAIFTAMLFATKDHCRPIFSTDDMWRFLADQGKKSYRSCSRTATAGVGGLLRRLFSGGGSGSTGSATTGLEKTVKEAFNQ